MTTVKINIRGMVQGVSFRAFAKRNADRLGVKGYVKNLGDGSVEILAEGVKAFLEQFVENVSEGPDGAKITSVGTDWTNGKPMFHDFKIIY